MACMGPSWDKNLPKQITEEILGILQNKYNLHNGGFDRANDKYEFDDHLKQKLLELMTEIVETDGVNGF